MSREGNKQKYYKVFSPDMTPALIGDMQYQIGRETDGNEKLFFCNSAIDLCVWIGSFDDKKGDFQICEIEPIGATLFKSIGRSGSYMYEECISRKIKPLRKITRAEFVEIVFNEYNNFEEYIKNKIDGYKNSCTHIEKIQTFYFFLKHGLLMFLLNGQMKVVNMENLASP